MDEGSVNIVIRAFDPDVDQACIYSTWRNSAYYGAPRKTNDAKVFFKKMTRTIREILKHATVRIACLEDDPLTIIGYSVSTGTHLDWIYVKVEYRMKGVGTLLLPKNIETVTDYFTKIGEVLVEKKKFKTKENGHGTGRTEKGPQVPA